MKILEVKNLKKIYISKLGGKQFTALKNVDFSVDTGEFIAIMGESGSGKTTLLNIISSLDKATSGEIFLDGKDISKINDKELSSYRRKNLGFVFQNFNLLDTFSVKDNIFLPLVLSEISPKEMNIRLQPIAKQLNIETILDKYPYEVSGGQQQRVAVARALITSPKLIFADEPTGALDSKSSAGLLKKFEEINGNGQTILMVTHSTQAASHANRVLFIKDGIVFHQLYRGEIEQQEFYQKIVETLTMITTGGEKHEK